MVAPRLEASTWVRARVTVGRIVSGPVSGLGFSALLEAHAPIGDALLLHEEALLLLDAELATELLAAHERLLALHMRHEEDVVLEVFRRVPPLKKWPVVLYTGQHEKIGRAHV